MEPSYCITEDCKLDFAASASLWDQISADKKTFLTSLITPKDEIPIHITTEV